MTAVVGVRVPDELKRQLEELKIDYSEDVRRLLEEKVRRKKAEEAIERLKRFRATLPKLEGDHATIIIREARDSR